MKKIIFILSAVLFSCSTNYEDAEKTETENVSSSLSKAFSYATVFQNGGGLRSSDNTTTNPDSIEQRMLSYLTAIYGVEFPQMYFENKAICTPDLSKYSFLSQTLIEDVNTSNVNQIISITFETTRNKLRSASSDGTLQYKVDDLLAQIEDTILGFTTKCIENESFDESVMKVKLLDVINNFKVNIPLDDLSSEEKVQFSTILLTLESSLDCFINYSNNYSTSLNNVVAQMTLRSTQSWLSSLVKQIVQVTIIVVCMTAGTVLGMVAGGAVTGGNPLGLGIGGAVGFAAGCEASNIIIKALYSSE